MNPHIIPLVATKHDVTEVKEQLQRIDSKTELTLNALETILSLMKKNKNYLKNYQSNDFQRSIPKKSGQK